MSLDELIEEEEPGTDLERADGDVDKWYLHTCHRQPQDSLNAAPFKVGSGCKNVGDPGYSGQKGEEAVTRINSAVRGKLTRKAIGAAPGAANAANSACMC